MHTHTYIHTHVNSHNHLHSFFLSHTHIHRHASMYSNRNLSLTLSLSNPLTHTNLQPTHFLCDLLECHSIFVTPVPSDLAPSHQWALADIADWFSDETDFKTDLIVHQISPHWRRLISSFLFTHLYITKEDCKEYVMGCYETECSWGSVHKYSWCTGKNWDTEG